MRIRDDRTDLGDNWFFPRSGTLIFRCLFLILTLTYVTIILVHIFGFKSTMMYFKYGPVIKDYETKMLYVDIVLHLGYAIVALIKTRPQYSTPKSFKVRLLMNVLLTLNFSWSLGNIGWDWDNITTNPQSMTYLLMKFYALRYLLAFLMIWPAVLELHYMHPVNGFVLLIMFVLFLYKGLSESLIQMSTGNVTSEFLIGAYFNHCKGFIFFYILFIGLVKIVYELHEYGLEDYNLNNKDDGNANIFLDRLIEVMGKKHTLLRQIIDYFDGYHEFIKFSYSYVRMETKFGNYFEPSLKKDWYQILRSDVEAKQVGRASNFLSCNKKSNALTMFDKFLDRKAKEINPCKFFFNLKN